MDWTYIESKYKQFKQEYDSARDSWIGAPFSEGFYQDLVSAKSRYEIFCTDVVEELMERNKDVLERLKNG